MDRIQLHGRFVVLVDDRIVDFARPGRRGQHLVAALAVRAGTAVARSTLISMLWPDSMPGTRADANFAALLSKTRTVLAPLEISGARRCLELVLRPGTLIDAKAAEASLHACEAAAAQRDWRRAWTEAISSLYVLQREFLPGFDEPWVARRRTELDQAHQRALACYAEACLELAGAELPSAERSAWRLVDMNPTAERGYCLLMRALARRGDRAAALTVFDRLRRTLRDQLGAAPGPASQALHQSLLG